MSISIDTSSLPPIAPTTNLSSPVASPVAPPLPPLETPPSSPAKIDLVMEQPKVHPRPKGRGKKGCVWDTGLGSWVQDNSAWGPIVAGELTKEAVAPTSTVSKKSSEEKEAERKEKLDTKEAERKAKLEAKEAERKEKLDAKEADRKEKLEAKEADKEVKRLAKLAKVDPEKEAAKALLAEEKEARKVAREAKRVEKEAEKIQRDAVRAAREEKKILKEEKKSEQSKLLEETRSAASGGDVTAQAQLEKLERDIKVSEANRRLMKATHTLRGKFGGDALEAADAFEKFLATIEDTVVSEA